MKYQKGFVAYQLILAVILLIGAGGWIANAVKFVGMLGGDINAMFIARIVGIFAPPFGAILGFF